MWALWPLSVPSVRWGPGGQDGGKVGGGGRKVWGLMGRHSPEGVGGWGGGVEYGDKASVVLPKAVRNNHDIMTLWTSINTHAHTQHALWHVDPVTSSATTSRRQKIEILTW